MLNTSWDKVAKQYDKHLTNTSDNYHNTLIIPKLIKLIHRYLPNKSSKIIDLACGQGIVTEAIFDDGYVVAGADISPELIKKAQHNRALIPYSVENAAKLSNAFIKANQNSSAVSVVLAAQNISDLEGLIRNAKNILRKDGYIFFVLNHPMFRIPQSTSWGYEENELQYRKVERYMLAHKIAIDMAPGDQTKDEKDKLTLSFHRSLQEYVKVLKKLNFVIVDLEEWVSNKVSEPGKRAKAENAAREEIPMFMTIVAQVSSH